MSSSRQEAGRLFHWTVSSYSLETNGNCVEVGTCRDGRCAVRDSTQRERGFLVFGQREWSALVRAVKRAEL